MSRTVQGREGIFGWKGDGYWPRNTFLKEYGVCRGAYQPWINKTALRHFVEDTNVDLNTPELRQEMLDFLKDYRNRLPSNYGTNSIDNIIEKLELTNEPVLLYNTHTITYMGKTKLNE
jgi:hypothetical protein